MRSSGLRGSSNGRKSNRTRKRTLSEGRIVPIRTKRSAYQTLTGLAA